MGVERGTGRTQEARRLPAGAREGEWPAHSQEMLQGCATCIYSFGYQLSYSLSRCEVKEHLCVISNSSLKLGQAFIKEDLLHTKGFLNVQLS